MNPSPTVETNPPLFERRVNATLARCTATFGKRGEEYGDTWAETRFLTMAAVAKQSGISVTQEQLRALACAAFVDFKYWRQLGGYKEDHYLDGINYAAYLVEEMREQTGKP